MTRMLYSLHMSAPSDKNHAAGSWTESSPKSKLFARVLLYPRDTPSVSDASSSQQQTRKKYAFASATATSPIRRGCHPFD